MKLLEYLKKYYPSKRAVSGYSAESMAQDNESLVRQQIMQYAKGGAIVADINGRPAIISSYHYLDVDKSVVEVDGNQYKPITIGKEMCAGCVADNNIDLCSDLCEKVNEDCGVYGDKIFIEVIA